MLPMPIMKSLVRPCPRYNPHTPLCLRDLLIIQDSEAHPTAPLNCLVHLPEHVGEYALDDEALGGGIHGLQRQRQVQVGHRLRRGPARVPRLCEDRMKSVAVRSSEKTIVG